MHNDIALNMDNGKVTATTLLDVSAVFNTINHTIPIDHLSLCYGVSGVALTWFKFYLSGRHQVIKKNWGLFFVTTYNSVMFWDYYLTMLSSLINRHQQFRNCLDFIFTG